MSSLFQSTGVNFVRSALRTGTRCSLRGAGPARILFRASILLLCLATSASSAELTHEQHDFFEKKIRSLLVDRCYECHSAGAKKLKGNLLLDSAAGVLKGGDTGPAVVPGNLEKSLLIKAIRWSDPDLQMPPKVKLESAQIADLEAWVKMGAPDSRTTTAAISPIEQRLADAKKHWAFLPIKSPPIPAVNDRSISSPVDAFILAKLAEKGVDLSAPTDKRTLIRRAYFDLIGLPPTPEDVTAFFNDNSAAAFEKVVDQLLASPRYSERWGRHWLDVARYADNMGGIGNFGARELYPYAYTYRDYVINAFNEDKPYDQFIIEQIAADLLPQQADDNHTWAALGFLTVGRRHDARVDDNVYDDRIDVMCRGLMGLTVGCARCHDHKLEPIPTTDYYGLYGILKSSKDFDVYPEIHPQPQTPAAVAYREESRKARTAVLDCYTRHVGKMLVGIRSHVGDYMLIAAKAGHKTLYANPRSTDAINKQKLLSMAFNQLASKWDTWVVKNPKVFSPWVAFEALDEKEFAEKAKPLAEQFAANTDGTLSPLVALMFKGDAPASLKDVAERYNNLFGDIDAKWRTKAADALAESCKFKESDQSLGERDLSLEAVKRLFAPEAEIKLDEPAEEEIRQLLVSKDSATVFPYENLLTSQMFPTEAQQEFRKVGAAVTALDALPGAPPRAMVVLEGKPYDAKVFIRGNPKTPGPDAPRQFLTILRGPDAKPFPRESSGRLELARAIASPGNPLTARVIVNRVWQWHFGEALVRTPSDFGFRGERPTHPELLDYLASRFISEGWSLKKLHRAIMLSQTYQQRSDPRPELAKVDVDNRLWGRTNALPLEFEPFRDAMLAVAGTLDTTQGGRAIDLTKTPSNRRTVYAFVDRKTLPNLFRSFDFPDPSFSIAQRTRSAMTPQALYLLNSPFIVDCAKALVARVRGDKDAHDDAAMVRGLYQLAYQREPNEREIQRALEFVAGFPKHDVVMPEVSDWQYGLGDYDPAAKVVKNFTALKFAGQIVKGTKLGKLDETALEINREGGKPSKDKAAIRRWIAPQNGHVDIYAELVHLSKTGDGVLCRLVSSRTGLLGEWSAANTSRLTALDHIEVKKGETLDFVTECRDDPKNDSFKWAPTITMREAEIPGMKGMSMRWDARSDFMDPATMPKPLGPWEELAQVLLLSNEFTFVE